MNSLVLHSYRRCPFAIRVRTVLEEKGLAYTVIEENLKQPSAELLRLHPEGKVPLLIHNGRAIPESAVITEYLDENFPAHPLRPTEEGGRSQIKLWTKWCDEEFKPALDLFKYKYPQLSSTDQADAIANLRQLLQKLTDALGSQPYLLGNDLTLADIHLFPFYRQLSKTGFPAHHNSPILDAWLNRITSRPAFEKVMEKK
jgi:glutathione S-transferase